MTSGDKSRLATIANSPAERIFSAKALTSAQCIAGDKAFFVTGEQLHDEMPAGLENAANLGGDPPDIKRVIKTVRVDAVDRVIAEHKRVKIAGDDIAVLLTGIKIDADGKMAKGDESPRRAGRHKMDECGAISVIMPKCLQNDETRSSYFSVKFANTRSRESFDF